MSFDQKDAMHKPSLADKMRVEYINSLHDGWDELVKEIKSVASKGELHISSSKMTPFLLRKLKDEKFKVKEIQEERNSGISSYHISWK